MRILYDSNGLPRVIEGTDIGLSGTLSLGSPFAGSYLAAANELPSVSVMNPSGGGVSAWPSADAHGAPGVAIREDFPGGAVQTALVSGGAGGPIGNIAVGRSSLGDGLVAFQQGGARRRGDRHRTGHRAPPADFVISAPKGWIRPVAGADRLGSRRRAPSFPSRYTVVLDGHELPTPAGDQRTLTRYAPPRRRDPLPSAAGDRRPRPGDAHPADDLKIDGQPPMVRINRHAAGTPSSSGSATRSPGSNAKGVSVSFGDGHRASGRSSFRHTYARAGNYTIVIHVRDNLGNTGNAPQAGERAVRAPAPHRSRSGRRARRSRLRPGAGRRVRPDRARLRRASIGTGEGERRSQQALYAHDPAISGDGRYVAFDGYFGGRTGVWRRNLGTGEVQPVAVGFTVPGSEACEQAACDAELPSISANGQLISFTTTADLDPSDATGRIHERLRPQHGASPNPSPEPTRSSRP